MRRKKKITADRKKEGFTLYTKYIFKFITSFRVSSVIFSELEGKRLLSVVNKYKTTSVLEQDFYSKCKTETLKKDTCTCTFTLTCITGVEPERSVVMKTCKKIRLCTSRRRH